jgi:hypothetical protein
MVKRITPDDIIPLIASLTTQERVRLIRMISGQPRADDAAVYGAAPTSENKFGGDEEPLAWEGEGWETFY